MPATVQVVQPSIDGERPITIHHLGTFTGEAGTIAGQRTLVLAQVIEGGEVLELPAASLGRGEVDLAKPGTYFTVTAFSGCHSSIPFSA